MLKLLKVQITYGINKGTMFILSQDILIYNTDFSNGKIVSLLEQYEYPIWQFIHLRKDKLSRC